MMLRQLFSFFPLEKHLAFFSKFFGTGFTPYLCYVLFWGGGRRRLRRQAWVLAESSRTRHSHESTGTDYSLRRTHTLLTPTRPGPIALEYFPAWPASQPKTTSPGTNEKRHNLVFDDTIRQDGPRGFDLCRDVQFWPSEQIRYPFPQRLEPFRASYVILPTPSFSRHVDRRLGALSSMKSSSLAQAQSLSYRHNLAATRNFRSSHSFNSLLLKAFDLFSTTSDSGVPRLVTLMALTERGKMDENI